MRLVRWFGLVAVLVLIAGCPVNMDRKEECVEGYQAWYDQMAETYGGTEDMPEYDPVTACADA